MEAGDFTEFIRDVHSFSPFRWQERLLKRVATYGWGNPDDPTNNTEGRTDLLGLPTAAGKTSLIDIAVFHLALQQAQRVERRTAPLRVFFVIDRRIVVDEAYRRACRLAGKLREATQGILKEAADALRSYSGVPDADPLHVAIMRGGMYRDDSWAWSPAQPTVCVSTVDQIGSRLLFRGYGLSEYQRPVHAGLIGCDSLIILDEAHISHPFVETLMAIRRYGGGDWCEVKPAVATPLVFVQMTATPYLGSNPFNLIESDRSDTLLNARLTSSKRALLAEVKTTAITKKMPRAEQRRIEAGNSTEFIERIVEEAKKLAGLDRPAQPTAEHVPRQRRRVTIETETITPDVPPHYVVGIVVNRVATARAIFEKLSALRGQNELPSCLAVLLTGRVRPYDRDELLLRVGVNGQPTGWLRYIRADRKAEDRLDRPLFVVATQTVEVGADLSFDALVTELASLDALRQRFGRLDRLGTRGVSKAVIITRKDKVASGAHDSVYGDALPLTWAQLQEWATVEGRGITRKTVVDFGIDALAPKLDGLRQRDPAALQAVCAPVKHAPVMLPAHVDTWCQTCPTPTADPDVALFLHGRDSGLADVQVVWRADLPEALDEACQDSYVATVSLVPPTSLESLPVPIWDVQAWLMGKAFLPTLTDLEGIEAVEENGRREMWDYTARSVLRWHGPDDKRTKLILPKDIRPGETIVVPSAYGGCDQFGWNPQSTARVCDIADPCARLARWRPVVRLHKDVVAAWQWPASGVGSVDLAALAGELGKLLSPVQDEESTPDFQAVLGWLREESRVPQWVRLVASELQSATNRRPPVPYPDGTGWMLERRRRLTREQIVAAGEEPETGTEYTTEGDASWMTGQKIELPKHLEGVRDRARRLAQTIGLSTEDELAFAGWLHDIGKADPRFQIWLHDGDEIAAAIAMADNRLLAKSGQAGRNRAAVQRARRVAGYPAGGRHECLSALMIQRNQAIMPDSVDRDLVCYLVGTHHGYGRPFMPVTHDLTQAEVELNLNGNVFRAPCNHRLHHLEIGWTDLFWTMIKRYGYWRLAYLEAIVRLADQQISQEEQKGQ